MGLTDETTGTESRHDRGDGPPVSFLHGQVEGVLDERLPRGQHELSRRYVAQHQRLRIIESMTHVLYRVGYLDLTVADVVKGARVSRRTFYEHFTDKQHCHAATFGAGVECIADAVRSAYLAQPDWDAGVAAAFSTLVRIVIEHPETGFTCLVQGGISGAESESARLSALRMCADGYGAMLARCGSGPQGDSGPQASPLQCELAVGAVAELLRARLAEGREADLVHELPETVVALLAGPIGEDRARAVAGRIEVPSDLAAGERRAAHP